MIPDKVALTFCQSCEESVQTGGLCSYGCRWDADTSHERPVRVVTYWRREDPKPFTEKDRPVLEQMVKAFKKLDL